MSKYLISALLLVGLGTLTMGITGGATERASSGEAVAHDTALLNQSPVPTPGPKVTYGVRTVAATLTAYSSQVGETDDTPFITATGTKVRPGVVAANWLPFGSKIRIPELFGDQVFTVEDRMNSRNGKHKVDIWFSSTDEALRFGTVRAQIEIL